MVELKGNIGPGLGDDWIKGVAAMNEKHGLEDVG